MTSALAPILDPLCGWLAAHGTSCFEMLGFVTGVLNVWLVTRQSLWSWPVGIVNAAVYTVVFARAGLYSDTGLQVVYLLLSVYGWWHWWRGAPDQSPLRVTHVPRRQLLPLSLILISLWVALALITTRIPGAALPWADALLVAGSLVAQWMMTRKLLECWLLWIVIDASYVGLFLWRGLSLTAVLYFLFLLLAVRGHLSWRRDVHA